MAFIIDKIAKKPCRCGCGQLTSGIRLYKNGKPYHPEYCHGHHKGRLGVSYPAWNKGLTKEDCPTLTRMGYQPGHLAYCNWDQVNKRLKEDSDFKEKWRESKRGIPTWNKGLTKDEYPHGIVFGPNHGNWKGVGKFRDTEPYRSFCKKIRRNNNLRCQLCDSDKKIHLHHCTPVAKNKSRAIDPSNVVILCRSCHILIHQILRKKLSGT